MTLPFSIRTAGPFTLSAGQTGPLPFAWIARQAADLYVLRQRGEGPPARLVHGVDYSVAGVGLPEGGSVSLLHGALDGDVLYVVGDRLPTRQNNVSSERGVTPTILNHDADIAMAHIQELRRDVDRAFKASLFSGAYDLEGRRLMNVGPPVHADDAVTMGWAETSADSSVARALEAAAAASAAAVEAALYDPTFRYATVGDLLASERAAGGVGTIWQAGGYLYKEADPGATDHHVESAGGVKFYMLPGADGYSLLQWGASADVDLTTARVDWSGATDNTAIMLQAVADIIARDGGGTLHVPPGCLVDFSGLDYLTAAGILVIDDSQVDYARPAITRQVTTYWRRFTTWAIPGAGAWNGNGHINSADYNPGYVVESRAAAGTPGAVASFVFWHGNASADFQLAYVRSTENQEFFALSSYGPLANPTVVHRIGGQRSSTFRQHSFNSGALTGASYVFGQAGWTTDADWLTIGNNSYWTVPAGSTGLITHVFREGVAVRLSQRVASDGTWTHVTKNLVAVSIDANGAHYGHRRRVHLLTSTLNLATNHSGTLVTNIDAGGGIVCNLPAAAAGLHFQIHVDAAHLVQIDPNGGDAFVGRAAGKYMESATPGSWCEVTCVKAGVWTFRRGGTWTDE